MAKRFRINAESFVPPPYEPRIVNRDAFDALPQSMQDLLFQERGPRLLTAIELNIAHFTDTERRQIWENFFKAVGMEMAFGHEQQESD